MSLRIFHTVNAGLCFQTETTALLVDILHQGQELGFSPTPDTVCRQMLAHRGPFQGELLFVLTHQHSDHFAPKLMRKFLDEYPTAKVYGPNGLSRGVRPVRLDERTERIEFNGCFVTAFLTDHDGKQYKGCPHHSLWIHIEGDQHLVCGDAKLNRTVAEHMSAICGTGLDTAFVNIYQLSSPDGRAFLSVLHPKRILLYHLPMPEDDIYHYPFI